MLGKLEKTKLILMAAFFAAQSIAIAQPSVVRIEAIGTAFRVTLSDGTIKQGTELVGTVLVFKFNGRLVRVRIAAITPDPRDKTGTILLHDFRVEPTGTPLCSPDSDGKQLGFPLSGRTTADGRFVAAKADTFELVCTSGAQGKCVRFGYHPWEIAADGKPMRAYYNACIRLMRADYCGDGRAWTRNGTKIDLWDDLGIQRSESKKDPTFSFEAGWGPDGAVCVAHTRIPENITLNKLKEYCPRLNAVANCNVGSARAAGALLFNRSH